MSRPTLPYSADDIANMTDPVARARARAELTSLIARLRMNQGNTQIATEQPSKDAFTTEASATQSSNPQTARTGYRGGHRGGHRGADWGRGGSFRAAMHHPYQRPHGTHAAFKNNSVNFTNSAVTTESSHTPPLIVQILHEESAGQRTEPAHCSSFTRTGIQIRQATSQDAPSRTGLMHDLGKCTRHACRLTHDPNKVAICKTWLYNSKCPKGDSCPLSHEPTSHNAPTCEHFQESRCNNENCNFAHVRVNPAAQNCVDFGTMFYCEKGSSCAERHAFECPYFSNTGKCFYGDDCRNTHVRNAARMRKNVSEPSSPAAEVDEAEDEQDNDNAANLCGTNDSSTYPIGEAQAFTQQDDYLPL